MSHLIGSDKSEYRTTCKICKLGIFASHQTAWGRGQHLGLVHAACAPELPVLRPSAPADPTPAPVRTVGGVLTDRQIDLVQQLANGSTVHQIAEREHLTPQSVYNQLRNARLRIGADDHTGLIAAARRAGLITRGADRA